MSDDTPPDPRLGRLADAMVADLFAREQKYAALLAEGRRGREDTLSSRPAPAERAEVNRVRLLPTPALRRVYAFTDAHSAAAFSSTCTASIARFVALPPSARALPNVRTTWRECATQTAGVARLRAAVLGAPFAVRHAAEVSSGASLDVATLSSFLGGGVHSGGGGPPPLRLLTGMGMASLTMPSLQAFSLPSLPALPRLSGGGGGTDAEALTTALASSFSSMLGRRVRAGTPALPAGSPHGPPLLHPPVVRGAAGGRGMLTPYEAALLDAAGMVVPQGEEGQEEEEEEEGGGGAPLPSPTNRALVATTTTTPSSSTSVPRASPPPSPLLRWVSFRPPSRAEEGGGATSGGGGAAGPIPVLPAPQGRVPCTTSPSPRAHHRAPRHRGASPSTSTATMTSGYGAVGEDDEAQQCWLPARAGRAEDGVGAREGESAAPGSPHGVNGHSPCTRAGDATLLHPRRQRSPTTTTTTPACIALDYASAGALASLVGRLERALTAATSHTDDLSARLCTATTVKAHFAREVQLLSTAARVEREGREAALAHVAALTEVVAFLDARCRGLEAGAGAAEGLALRAEVASLRAERALAEERWLWQKAALSAALAKAQAREGEEGQGEEPR